MSQGVTALLNVGEDPYLEAALVKDVGATFEQDVPEVARTLLDTPPDPDGAAGAFSECLSESILNAPAFSLRGGAICHQVHGAMGFTQENPLHFYSRRPLAWRDEFGCEPFWQETIGQLVCANGADALWPLLSMVEAMLRYKRLDGVAGALATIGDRLIAGTDLSALTTALQSCSSILVLASEGDRIAGRPDPARLPAQAEIHLIKNVSHMPHLESPVEVSQAIRRYIESR